MTKSLSLALRLAHHRIIATEAARPAAITVLTMRAVPASRR
jgi:hypothetical protein